MTTQTEIVQHAETVFDQHGFAASGMDRLTEAAGVSTRTLYKHVGSKNGLIEAVLTARQERFFAYVRASSIHELFADLEGWIAAEGARGCLFLRAEGENGGKVAEISGAVEEYHRRLHDLIARIVRSELRAPDPVLTDQILALFEGATSAATYRGASAVQVASAAASALLSMRLADSDASN